MYVSPVGCIMRRRGVSYHMYADDSQVYITFKSDDLEDLEIARGTLEQCIVDVNNWMLQNNLKLNQDKSELIVMLAKHRLKPSLESIQVGESTIVHQTVLGTLVLFLTVRFLLIVILLNSVKQHFII